MFLVIKSIFATLYMIKVVIPNDHNWYHFIKTFQTIKSYFKGFNKHIIDPSFILF